MRYETRRTRVNDPDASPGWYDDDENTDEFDIPNASGKDTQDDDRSGEPRRATGRHLTLATARNSPYATRQFRAVRAHPTTVELPSLPRITRRMPAMPAMPSAPHGSGAVGVTRAHDAASPALRAFCEAPTGKQRALPRGVTLVPGGARMPQRPVVARKGRPPHPNWKISAGAILLVVVLAGAIRVFGAGGAGPLGYDGLVAAVGQPRVASKPLGRRVAGADAADASTNPWQAGAFSVPVLGGGGAAAPGALAKAPTPVPTAAPRANPPAAAAPAPASGVLAAPFTPWPPRDPWMWVPGHSPYRVYDYAGDPYAAAFGQCTWWAQYERRDENLRGMGNAQYWAAGAAARGLRVGGTPQANATVVFQPYVQGASPVGHVGHVLAVYPSGWFLMSEMNAFGNGGGWGRVSYRYAHAGPGVSFIY